MKTPATLTLGFAGAGYDSVWFTPLRAPADAKIDEGLFSQAKHAREMAQALLSCGCSMATRSRPDLAESLAALAATPLSLDFFDYPDASTGLGWFRLSAQPAKGATPEALAACEQALAAAHAPLLCAKADGALLAFANGSTDELPAPFRAAAHEASGRIAQLFEQSGAGAVLSHTDITILASADGSKKLAVCAPAASSPSDPLADFKTFAKLAQSGIEARRSAAGAQGSQAFFDALDKALGAHPDSPALLRRLVPMAPGAFFPMPASARAVEIGGLPGEAFEEMSKLFMQSMSKRFGALAASPRAEALFRHQGAPLTVSEQASLAGLFSKLPPLPPPQPASEPAVRAPGL